MKKRRTKVIVCPDAHIGHHTLDLTPLHIHTPFPFLFRQWIKQDLVHFDATKKDTLISIGIVFIKLCPFIVTKISNRERFS